MTTGELVQDVPSSRLGGKGALRPTSPAGRLWRNRTFTIFWFGQTLSGLGDAFALIAMPFLVLQVTGSVARMGLVTGTFGAMDLLGGMFAGALLDKLDRRRLMIACDLGRLLVYSLIPLGWLLVGPQIWLIYVTTAVGSILGYVFSIGTITAVVNLVDNDQITDANGWLQVSSGLSLVAGPILAGVTIALFNPTAAIGADAISFLVSAITLMCIRPRQRTVMIPTTGGKRTGHSEEWLAGMRFLVRQPLLRTLTIVNGITNMMLLGAMDLFIYRLKHDLHHTADTVGLVFSIAGVGAILAGVLSPRLRRRFGFGACWIGGLCGTGLGLLAFALTGSMPLIVMISTLFLFVNTVTYVANRSVRQEITPDHLLGRVTAACWTLSGVTAPIGAAVSTALAAKHGAPAVLAGMGVITVVVALISIGTPINHRHPEQLYAQDDGATRVAVATP